jgi:hypothetical protein
VEEGERAKMVALAIVRRRVVLSPAVSLEILEWI